MDDAALDAAAGQPPGKRRGMMPASIRGFADLRRPSEFGRQHHEGRRQQAAIVRSLEQGR